MVSKHRGLNCAQAASIGSHVTMRYERGLPLADYPPPPAGVPGGRGHTLHVTTAIGKFISRMTSRGSDFVAATRGRGSKSVRFESLNHYFLG